MGIKIYIYIIIFTLLSAAIGGAYWYFNWSQQEIENLRGNVKELTIAVKTQEDTIASQIKDAMLKNDILLVTNQDYEKARSENTALRRKLAKHDIAYLASKKPKLVGKILTKGTKDAERCFEILSGDPLTESEKAATKKSKANGTCPELANPNYTVKP